MKYEHVEDGSLSNGLFSEQALFEDDRKRRSLCSGEVVELKQGMAINKRFVPGLGYID